VLRLPALVVELFREHRRVDAGRLQLEAAGATLQSQFRGMWRRNLATPKGMLACVGLGFAVGLLSLPRAAAGRPALLRSATLLLPLLANFRHRARDGHSRQEPLVP